MSQAAETLAGLSVFAASLGLGVVAHFNTPVFRRIVSVEANRFFQDLFTGSLVIDSISSLSINGLRIRSAKAITQEGTQGIGATDLRIELNALELLRRALFDEGELHIDIPFIRIDDADVLLAISSEGKVSLGELFALKARSSKPRATSEQVASRPIRVSMRDIELGHAWVHGPLLPSRSLDADVNRLHASIVIDSNGLALDAEPTGLVDRSFLPGRVSGTADYHLRAGQATRMWTSFTGELGTMPVILRAELRGQELSAVADITRAPTDAPRALGMGIDLGQPLAAHAELRGAIPNFRFKGSLFSPDNADESRIDFEGGLTAGKEPQIDVDLPRVDTHANYLVPHAPAIPIKGDGKVRITFGPTVEASVDLKTEPNRFGSTELPAVAAEARIRPTEIEVLATVAEPGMPTRVTLRKQGDKPLSFELASSIRNLKEISRLHLPMDGSARVALKGTLDPNEIHATAHARLNQVKLGSDVEMSDAAISGTITGNPLSPTLDLSLQGENGRAFHHTIDTAHATLRGSLERPALHLEAQGASASVKADGTYDAARKQVDGVRIALRDGERDTLVGAKQLAFGPSLAIRGLSISGALGKAEGSLEVEGSELVGSLTASGLDLEALGRIAGSPVRLRGKADANVHLSRDRNGRKGNVKIHVVNAEVGIVSGLRGELAATFEGMNASADASIALSSVDVSDDASCGGDIGRVRLHAETDRMFYGPLSADVYAEGAGRLEVTGENWNLACLQRMVPVGLPLTDLRGRVDLEAEVERGLGDDYATLRRLLVRTSGLELAGQQTVWGETGWESRKLDVALKAAVDGRTGKGDATIVLADDAPLISVDVSADLDLDALSDRSDVVRVIGKTPLSGHVGVPRRPVSSLASLPSFLRDKLPIMYGDVRFDAYLDGTLDRPFATVRGMGYGLTYVGKTEANPLLGSGDWAIPVDADLSATYDASGIALEGHVSENRREIAAIKSNIDVEFSPGAALRGELRPTNWKADVVASLSELPLSDLPFLADRQIGGHLSGLIELRKINDAPTLDVSLNVPDLAIGPELFFEEGTFSARISKNREGKDTAIGKLHLVSQEGGQLSAVGYGGITWQDSLFPALDRTKAADLYTRAERFRLAAIQPFVANLLSKLDGYVDGEVRLGWQRLEADDEGSVTAELRVTDGVFHIPQVGQELRSATVSVRAEKPKPGEPNFIRFENFNALGVTGRIEGWALSRLQGLRLVDAAGQLSIDRDERVPLTIEGVPLGTAYGVLKFMATNDVAQDVVRVGIELPAFHIELPQSSGRAVQSLDESPDIRIRQSIVQSQIETGNPSHFVFTFHPFDVRLSGPGLNARLNAGREPPTIEFREVPRVTGEVNLSEGQLSTFGKTFEIEHGLVQFRSEDPSNPYVNLTAFWDPPDAGRIYVDFVGNLRPLTKDKLHFRSSPPRSQQEIISFLLLGETRDPTSVQAAINSSGSDLSTGMASSLVFGTFAGLTVRGGPTPEGTAQVTVAKDLTEDLSIEATYAGASAGNNPAETESNSGAVTANPIRLEGAADWRFHRNWSLRPVFGTGTTLFVGLDLVWQYRY